MRCQSDVYPTVGPDQDANELPNFVAEFIYHISDISYNELLLCQCQSVGVSASNTYTLSSAGKILDDAVIGMRRDGLFGLLRMRRV